MDRPNASTRRASRRRCRSSILKSLDNSSRITTESPSALRSGARASADASALRRRPGTSFPPSPQSNGSASIRRRSDTDNGEQGDLEMKQRIHVRGAEASRGIVARSEEHTSELQSRQYLVCRLLL